MTCKAPSLTRSGIRFVLMSYFYRDVALRSTRDRTPQLSRRGRLLRRLPLKAVRSAPVGCSVQTPVACQRSGWSECAAAPVLHLGSSFIAPIMYVPPVGQAGIRLKASAG